MRSKFFILSIFAVGIFAAVEEKPHPLSEQFINEINNKQSTWKAGKNFEIEDLDRVRGLLGSLKDTSSNSISLPRKTQFKVTDLPEEFNSLTNWPNCTSIGKIRDQGSCGSCWALSAVEAMTDRICIASNGEKQVSVSGGDLLSCCWWCGFGCNGGIAPFAWTYWLLNGIVTGGEHGTSEGCIAYPFPQCNRFVNGTYPDCGEVQPIPECKKECDDPSSLNYKQELTYGRSVYNISTEAHMKAEIFENGPIQTQYDVYEDFLNYKSGVYQHLQGEMLGGHGVKIIGWGVEDETPYWLVANSWNEEWGDKGFFKILRGNSECGIEDSAVGGLPRL